MALDTKADVLAFLEANRQMFVNKTGFRHFAEQLQDVITFIENLAAENEQLKASRSS